jgi:hypothetical protein
MSRKHHELPYLPHLETGVESAEIHGLMSIIGIALLDMEPILKVPWLDKFVNKRLNGELIWFFSSLESLRQPGLRICT